MINAALVGAVDILFISGCIISVCDIWWRCRRWTWVLFVENVSSHQLNKDVGHSVLQKTLLVKGNLLLVDDYQVFWVFGFSLDIPVLENPF